MTNHHASKEEEKHDQKKCQNEKERHYKAECDQKESSKEETKC
jgi:hypothetical protein